MKGMQGLMIAGACGIVGAVCNWLYVYKLASNYKSVEFVAISRDARINAGDRFKLEHLRGVPVPENNSETLKDVAVLWRDRHTVIGDVATINYNSSEILMRQHLKTPSYKELSKMIAKEERVMWLPVDTRTFVPERVNPGDRVSFIVPRFPGRRSTAPNGSDTVQAGANTIVGPFDILALGTRTGRRDVQLAARGSSGRENVMAIRVKMSGKQLEPKAQQLSEVLQLTNFQQVQVLLHPDEESE